MFIYLLSILSLWGTIDYAKIFGLDYQKALNFCEENNDLFQKRASTFEQPVLVLKAIVFPEIIRHSNFQDFFETKMLEQAYVYQGTALADFSIGQFQMKPSFIEKLEKEILSNTNFSKVFKKLVVFASTEEKDIRLERVQRLKSVAWQLDYLCCFYAIVNNRFRSEIAKLSTAHRIKLLATAYNCGFDKSWETIKNWSMKSTYPYGPKYPENQQYNYGEIAWDYYKNN